MASHRVNGTKLIALRTKKNWSARALAEYAKCARGSVLKAEKNDWLEDDVIERIAKALKVTPEELWDNSHEDDALRLRFADYLRWQRQIHEDYRYLEIKTIDTDTQGQASVPKVEDLFIEPYLLTEPVSPEATPAEWTNVPLAMTLIEKPEPLVILGDAGSGKSTLGTYLTLQLAESSHNAISRALGNRLPILFVLHRLKLTPSTTADELVDSFWRATCPQTTSKEMIWELIRMGRAVLIFDGLDEISRQSRENLRGIVWSWMKDYSGNRYIATSRPLVFEEVPFDLQIVNPVEPLPDESSSANSTSVRLPSPPGRGAGGEGEPQDDSRYRSTRGIVTQRVMTRLYLAPFDNSQIRQFIDRWYRQRIKTDSLAQTEAQRLWDSTNGNPATLTLARIPNILTIMTILHERKKVLPDGRAKLYSKIADAYLEGLDQSRGIPTAGEFRGTLDQQKLWLGRVAWEIQQRRWRNELADKNERVADEGLLLVTHDDLVAWIAAEQAPMTRWGRRPAPHEISLFLKKAQERAGLLIERGEGRYAFVHLSFVEYFAGYYLLHRHENLPALLPSPPGRGAGGEGAPPANPIDLADLPNHRLWHEPLLFAFGEGKEQAHLRWDSLLSAIFAWLDDLATGQPVGERSSSVWLLLTKLSEDRYAGFDELRDQVRHACVDHALRVDPLSLWPYQRGDKFRDQWLNEFDDLATRAELRRKLIAASVRRPSPSASPLLPGEGPGVREDGEKPPETTLICRSFNITVEDILWIAQTWPLLTTLDLGGNEIGDAGARAIAEHLPQLTTLDLGGNKIGEAGARAIAEHLPLLTTLDLGGNQIGEAGVRAIAEHLPLLTALDLPFNQIGDAGARAIAEHLPQLTTLDLGNNKIGDAGARAIAEHLPLLTALDLPFNQIGDAGARAIAEHLPLLTTLDLGANQIGEAGAQAIAEHLPLLTRLELSANKIGEAVKAELRRLFQKRGRKLYIEEIYF